MKLIDKAALLTSIKKLNMDIGNIFNDYDEGFWDGRITAFDDVICALDNLEVKEVDLEKELEGFVEQQNALIRDDRVVEYNNGDSFNHIYDLQDVAEHFFELGLNAQNEK